MHKAWCCFGEVPCRFSRSSVKFQGDTSKKIVKFDPDWAFPDCYSSFNSPVATKRYTKLGIDSIKEVPNRFSRSSLKFQGHTDRKKIVTFDPDCAFPDCYSSFNSPVATKWPTKLEIDSIKEVPNCFSRSSLKFQGHTDRKRSTNLIQIGRFRTVTPVSIHPWLQNDAHSLK